MPPNTNLSPGRPANGAAVGVALIDGTPLVREGLSALVHRTPGLRWVGAAENPSVGLRLCERLRPDVVVVDSGLDSRGQLSHLLSGNPNLGVLLLVDEAHRTTQYIAGAVAAGVGGVVLRSAQPPQLVKAIQAVHSDGRYLDAALAALLAAPVTGSRRVNGVRQPLSQREHQVLQLIADGLENQAIANVLFVSVETVRTHVKSILRKLASRDRTHAVAVAFRSGVLTLDGAVPRARGGSDVRVR
ncbi:LuxR C-terminal-related transcriptional regulator [Actinophytocola glycyrrhizae]|uniref:LuxR C-terminal-related transcriptional regulator n=1 Tax=Actinophytocola glycyrrhizae TaxID=2044873 RepID=A0ABV9S3B3_9PSEU